MRISDWSSDVCSSDLQGAGAARGHCGCAEYPAQIPDRDPVRNGARGPPHLAARARWRLSARPVPDRHQDRKSVVSGKSVSVRVHLGGSCIIQKKTYDKHLTINTDINNKQLYLS